MYFTLKKGHNLVKIHVRMYRADKVLLSGRHMFYKKQRQMFQYLTTQLKNQSTEGAEFFCVSECQKGEGCEIINQLVFV
jgi:hypothetical protein